MSYAMSAALQSAIYQTLIANKALKALVGSEIYDSLYSGLPPDLYVSIGAETVVDASDITDRGAIHRFTISVFSTDAGFSSAKAVAGAVCDALLDTPISLTRGKLIGITFDKASAARTANTNSRQIDLRFRARVEDQTTPILVNNGDLS